MEFCNYLLYHFKIRHHYFGLKEGFILEDENDNLSEISPLPGRNLETLDDVLQALQNHDTSFPSVSFGLWGLTAPCIKKAPVCLFLHGSPDEILQKAKNNFGCKTAKVKLGNIPLPSAINLIKTLKQEFRLRLDLNGKWSEKDLLTFCSHFSPGDFETIEDPGIDISPFPMASDMLPLGTPIWKPMVRGLPSPKQTIILSSSFETAIGLHHIASLAHAFEIPPHPLGIGTYLDAIDDILIDPLIFKDGEIYFPAKFTLKKDRIQKVTHLEKIFQ